MNIDKRKLRFLLIPILVAGTAAFLHAHLKNIRQSPPMAEAPWALNAGLVEEGRVDQGFPALGRVASSSDVRIAPQISGTVLQMGPREGGRVHAGDLIVRLDTRELEAAAGAVRARLASAKAQLDNDRKELQREQRLLAEGGSSTSAVERYQTRVRADLANVDALKKQLKSLEVKVSYGRITSPVNGRVSRRLAEPGDTVFPGKAIYVLAADRGGRVIVPVPLDTLTHVRVGGNVQLFQGTQSMVVKVTRINPSLDKLAMGRIEIDLPSRPFHLPDGAPVATRVITGAATGLTVPVDALRPSENRVTRTLFKIVGKKRPVLRRVSVHVRLCGKTRCVVAGELKKGDLVVTANGSVLLQLRDGDHVTVNRQGAMES